MTINLPIDITFCPSCGALRGDKCHVVGRPHQKCQAHSQRRELAYELLVELRKLEAGKDTRD